MTSMAPHVSLVLNWILILALFPIAFIWLRRAWRIMFKRDYSEVALKRGLPPPNPEKYAPYTLLINLVAGVIIVVVLVGVLVLGAFDYETWTSLAGGTIWCKFILDFALGRTAHPFEDPKKTENSEGKPSLKK